MSGALTQAESPATAFSSVDAMTALLTVESLIFAMVGLSLALLAGTGLARRATDSVRILMVGVGLLITLVALGAGVGWADSFLGEWPSGLAKQVPLACIGIGILAQPILAWLVIWLAIRRVQVEGP